MKRILLAIVLLILSFHLLTAAITAEYAANPTLHFANGNTISTPNTPLGTFSKSQLVGYVGTITITAVGEQLRRPIIRGVNTTSNFMFTGLFSMWNPQEIIGTEFNLYVKTALSNTPKIIWIENGGEINGWSNTVISQNLL